MFEEARSALATELGPNEPDLLLAFLSNPPPGLETALPLMMTQAFPRALLVGCSASGVIGGGHEIESRPALSLVGAVLPGVTLVPFAIAPQELAELATPSAWCARLDVPPEEARAFILLGDPASCDTSALLRGLDAAYPASPKIGGLASGIGEPGDGALYIGAALRREGMVGVALRGNVALETIVAQGCRPIGKPMVVTACRGNVIDSLDRRSPADVLRALHDELTPRDRELFRHSLFIGVELGEGKLAFQRGETLARDLIGVDPERGSIAISQSVRPWQVVEFLLRDARTARQDLAMLLDRFAKGDLAERTRGALLFSCLGRGVHLYGEPDHDSALFQERLGPVPLGGFFCNGEIGPIGSATFLHGYSSAFGLFRER
jgi:small ligand-binding sensory domain FIST